MALNIITVLQEDTYAITEIECHMFITDESVNVSSLRDHMRIQANALSDLRIRTQ